MIFNILSNEDIKLVKRGLKYIYPYKFKFIIVLFCIILNVGFTLAQPFLWGLLLVGLFKNAWQSVVFNIGMLCIVHVLGLTSNFVWQNMYARFSRSIIFELRKDIFDKIMGMPVKAFDDMSIGEFLSRLHEDTSSLVNIMTRYMVNIIADVIRVVFLSIAMIKISWVLSLVVLAAFPLNYIIFSKFGKALRQKSKDMTKENDRYFSTVQESLAGIREIKSLGVSKNRIKSFITRSKSIRDKGIKVDTLEALAESLSEGIELFVELMLLVAGGFLIYNGQFSMEYYIEFSAYTEDFFRSVLNITRVNSIIQQLVTSLERIFNLMDNLSYSEEKYGAKVIEPVKADIEFKDVCFEYSSGKQVLSNINFIVPANKRIAIVGHSGSGKTTVMNLLTRFYKTTSGEILIDGVNINELDEECLRRIISIVRQEPFLFNMTIKENLMMANPQASESDMYEACKLAFINEFIESLPEKYDTMIGENAVKLSGGQKQRLAIARAVLKNPKIILLDEATSSLDNESQYYIKSAIQRISENHTLIVVAHRFSMVLDSDEIFLFDDGKIVARGTHEYLVKTCKEYKSLYAMEAV